jgi:hypothetical protein
LWNDAVGAAYYALAKNDIVGATTTATSSIASVGANAATTLSVVAYDSAGNTATSSGVSLQTITQPAVINEIGWAGDGVDTSHQWVEIKNVSSYTLDLSHLALTRSAGAPIQLSGTTPAVGNPFMLVEATDIPFTGTQKVIDASFALSTTTAEQLSLVWNSSTAIDTTPAVGACSAWCAGSYSAKLGTNATGIPDLFSPLSMERKTGIADGSLVSSWQNNDSYGPWLGGSNTAALWGTPDSENSAGLPDAGVYCGSADNLVQANSVYHPLSHTCTFLSRFITGDGQGVNRLGAFYRGDVGSSTNAGSTVIGKGLAVAASGIIPNDAQPNEHFFFAIWEMRSGPAFNSDTSLFNSYLTLSGSTTLGIAGPPHGNYVTIPWIYQP